MAARRTHDRGAALLEFAIVGPLLFVLLIGMFTGGVAFNHQLAVTNGVREGSRFGATLSVASAGTTSCSGAALDCWLAQVATVTQQASEGQLASPVAARNVCVAYVSPGLTATDQTRRLVRTASGDVLTTGSTCFTDGRPASERRVQVQGSRDGYLEWVLGQTTLTLESRSVTRFEATP